MVASVEQRALGDSGIDVSVLSLGSWRTYERLPREQGLAVMRAARQAGITFLDDARYNDETGNAPIASGYSEMVFGELFRAAGWRREEVVVANKLWWEFWPEQTAEQELDGSLQRMGFDHVDLIYSCWPPPGLSAEVIVESVGRLLRAGKARAWGFVNWEPALVAEASQIAHRIGVPPPAAAQLPYFLGHRQALEGPDARKALSDSGAAVVASFALAGGALTGKYTRGGSGRYDDGPDDPDLKSALATGERLAELAERTGTSASALALAFALNGPGVASVLFGATSEAQLEQNLRALEVPTDLLDAVRGLD